MEGISPLGFIYNGVARWDLGALLLFLSRFLLNPNAVCTATSNCLRALGINQDTCTFWGGRSVLSVAAGEWVSLGLSPVSISLGLSDSPLLLHLQRPPLLPCFPSNHRWRGGQRAAAHLASLPCPKLRVRRSGTTPAIPLTSGEWLHRLRRRHAPHPHP
jgi:hypothetical protein